MFWNKNAWNMKDFLIKYMKTEINELKKRKFLTSLQPKKKYILVSGGLNV